MPLYLGCPVWGLKGWVGNFFPAGAKQRDFLALYSRRLNAVEGNTTFYVIPGHTGYGPTPRPGDGASASL